MRILRSAWLACVAAAAEAACPPASRWSVTDARPGNFDDVINAVAVDAAGNVVACGSEDRRDVAQGLNWLIRRYDGGGTPAWSRSQNGAASGDDVAYGVAIDPSGSVYVAGSEDRRDLGQGLDWVLRKYSGAGVLLWTRTHNGKASGDDAAYGVAVDASGSVYVAGAEDRSDLGQGLNWLVRKYDPAGNVLWTRTANSPANRDDVARAIAVAPDGRVRVGGSEDRSDLGQGLNWVVRAYTAGGADQWMAAYNGPTNDDEEVRALAAFPDGGVVAAGSAVLGGSPGWLVRRYDPAGTLAWSRTPDDAALGPGSANAAAADVQGNAVVAGFEDNGGAGQGTDWVVRKYDSGGGLMWTQTYGSPGGGDDAAAGVGTDATGGIVVGGAEDRGDLGQGLNWLIRASPPFGPAGLEASLEAEPRAPLVGQEVEIRLALADPAECSVEAIAASLAWDDPAAVRVIAAPSASSNLSLAAGADTTLTWRVQALKRGTVRVTAAANGASANGGGNVSASSRLDLRVQEGPSVASGRLVIAPNLLDLSVSGASVGLFFQGNPAATVEARVYDSAGAALGAVSVVLDAAGAGDARLTAAGVNGHGLGPGAYWIVARGGGVADREPFFVVSRRE